ncbi:caspase activity and apoptosis inhibitor 1 [Nematolebias whitei]|uniref:caspase activity and apoptosis inhibitor 1 n=1 Tax=Nematolebias whitei TaxID=451745 RepID=UPI001896FCA7|nr:caspase activity and apoptosis inhibitor 1 [Nematolebias whitei]
MLKKKSSAAEKKRKHSKSEERQEGRKRRSSEPHLEDSKDELADPELDRIGSDIEEGGLDLSVPFQTITAYISDKQEMLQQCFQVLGEKKLRKMLPDELKDCGLEEIRALCWEQLEPISEQTLLQILAGEEPAAGVTRDRTSESQQDNNVDSTSCLKEPSKTDEPKQEAAGSGEESDVLSINADTYDSDIEGSKEEPPARAAAPGLKAGAGEGERSNLTAKPEPTQPETKKDIQSDIDRSVSEILAFSPAACKDGGSGLEGAPQSADADSGSQPSIQQLELLELEMRARAIKALMKAGDKKLCMSTNT